MPLLVYKIINHTILDTNAMDGLYRREPKKSGSRSIIQFGWMVGDVLGNICPSISSKLLDYGCFCGRTVPWPPKSNETVDEFDALCLKHDWCYHVVGTLDECHSYLTTHKYYIIEHNAVHCGIKDGENPNNNCQETLCQCDIQFVNSMRKLIENNGTPNCPTESPECPK